MKKIILKILSLPGLRTMFKMYCNYIDREKHVSYGKENLDKIFYVIGQKEPSGGLWWIINKVVMHIAYAHDKNYIPVIDYKHYWTQYHNIGELNRTNVWEKFFLQPSGYSLENISRSHNIIISDKYSAPSDQYLMGNTDFYECPERLNYFRSVFKQYITFTPNTLNLLNEMRDKIIPENSRVLGILCRGTDYLLKKPKGHPVQPNPQDVIEDAKKVIREYHCDYIFLATEDRSILDLFKSEFGDQLLYVNQRRVSKEEMQAVDLLIDANKKSIEDKYMMGINYLASTYILSKCNCFIGGRTGGTKGVLLMSDSFEYKQIYNLGFYN